MVEPGNESVMVSGTAAVKVPLFSENVGAGTVGITENAADDVELVIQPIPAAIAVIVPPCIIEIGPV
jgi:hypothetical protein